MHASYVRNSLKPFAMSVLIEIDRQKAEIK